MHDSDLAHVYATRLLNEINSASKFNGEPALTAINLLYQQDKTLPIYGFLLSAGLDAAQLGDHEVVGKALESLGPHFPAALYRELCEVCLPLDRAVINMGIATHIVENSVSELYPLLDEIVGKTRHDELHRYVVLLLAASRDEALIERLFVLAETQPRAAPGQFYRSAGTGPRRSQKQPDPVLARPEDLKSTLAVIMGYLSVEASRQGGEDGSARTRHDLD